MGEWCGISDGRLCIGIYDWGDLRRHKRVLREIASAGEDAAVVSSMITAGLVAGMVLLHY